MKYFRKDGDVVFRTFAVADQDGARGEVNVLDAQGEHFVQAHAGAIVEARHGETEPVQMPEDVEDSVPDENHGKAFDGLGVEKIEVGQHGHAEKVRVKEDEGVERLILGRGREVQFRRSVGEKGLNDLRSKVGRVSLTMEVDEASNPAAVCFNST